MPYEIRTDGGRLCVYKQGTDQKMGCHDSEEAAKRQMAALYAAEGKGMEEKHFSYLVNLDLIELSENNGTASSWIHALPIGNFQHPLYGEMKFTSERVTRFAENVKKKVRGIDLSIHYGHDVNGATPAAGWVKDADARADGLWLFVEWVADATKKIKDRAFKYFSADIIEEWTRPDGQTFQDVIFGGALTNRPFMKNLVPINLSEATLDNAFELVSTITGTPLETLKGKDNSMELTEDQLSKIVEGVTTKLSEQLNKKTDPPKPDVPKLEDIAELKTLAEQNPTVKALMHHFQTQGTTLHEMQKQLRETEVTAKLAEFDNSKLTLTPTAKELLHEIMVDPGLPAEVSGKIWELMEQVRTSQSFLVELGERSGAPVRYGYGSTDKSATQIFTERVNQLMADEKMDFLSATDQVAREDPKLYDAYRAGDGAVKSV